MTDICLLLRVGERPDANMRKTLFTLANYMIDIKAKYLPFEGAERNFEASIVTDFKIGRQDAMIGTIFRAYIKYSDGRSIETTFLASYRTDWREACVERWEPAEIPDLSAGLPEDWKN